MEIHEIRYFLALCETLNFTRAAEVCHVTQPALTRAIKGLEEKLGGPLIHRERGNSHLTELGQMMQPYFRDMFNRMEEARRRAEDFVRMSSTTLRLGLMCTIGPSRFVDLFGGFTGRHEGVELYLRDGSADEMEEALITGDLDLAIYCKPGGESDAMHRMALFSERFTVAISPAHPFARMSEVRVADLDGQTYLSRAKCEYDSYLDRITQEQGVDVRTVYRSERDDWIQSMVLAGLGFTFLPEYAVLIPGIVTRPLVMPTVTRHVSLMTVRGRPHAPAVGAFVHECRRYNWAEMLRGERSDPPGSVAA